MARIASRCKESPGAGFGTGAARVEAAGAIRGPLICATRAGLEADGGRKIGRAAAFTAVFAACGAATFVCSGNHWRGGVSSARKGAAVNATRESNSGSKTRSITCCSQVSCLNLIGGEDAFFAANFSRSSSMHRGT